MSAARARATAALSSSIPRFRPARISDRASEQARIWSVGVGALRLHASDLLPGFGSQSGGGSVKGKIGEEFNITCIAAL